MRLFYSLLLGLMLLVLQLHAENFLIFADYSGTDTPYNYNEYMEINIPESEAKSKWMQVAKAVSEDGISSFEWIPKSEKLECRTEIVSIQYMAKKTRDGIPSTAKQLVINIFKQASAQFPDMIWNTIQDDATDFIYEWSLPNGADGLPRQHEIVRVVSTDRGFHRIAFEKRVPRIDEHTRQLWIVRLGSSRLFYKDPSI